MPSDQILPDGRIIRNYPFKKVNFKDHKDKWQEMLFCAAEEETTDQLTEIFKEQHYKKGLIKKNMVIVDIGANIGMSALYFQDYAKMIYAIEPSPFCYHCLVENTKDFTNIKTFNFGISYHNDKSFLTGGTEDSPPQSLYREYASKFVTPILLKSFEDFIKENNIEHIDLLKIDCEGAEYEIFLDKSFQRIAPKIDYIIGEAHNLPSLWPELLPDILKVSGFKVTFMPFKNMNYQIYFTNRFTGEKTNIVHWQKTIFFAEKIQKKK